MKALFAATAAIGLALTTTPALADHHMNGEMKMTAEQMEMYNGWTEGNRAMYDGWPDDAQTYYWTLDGEQQDIWWNNLNDEQRVRIVGMNAQQRTAAWTSINNQMNGNANAAASNASTTARANSPAMSGNVRFQSNAMIQNIPAAHNGEYPPCRGDMQDNCINPREAGLNYGNRPLNYWPGQPASEIDGPLPANRPGN